MRRLISTIIISLFLIYVISIVYYILKDWQIITPEVIFIEMKDRL